ncbi:MAG: hypothetical protein ACRBDX_01425 [Gammaproteobacteria bacterium]
MDKAWAEFKTPLSQEALLLFCGDVEQLFRINPYLEVNKWEVIEKDKYSVDLTNHSQASEFSLQTYIEVTNVSNGVQLDYNNGIKSSTTIITQPQPEGSKLVITDHYRPLDNSNSKLLTQVDKSLHKWAEEIQNYLTTWQRWSWFLPWRLYKKHIWLPMKPSARRITYMLIWISLIEIALIGLGIIIYFIEYR